MYTEEKLKELQALSLENKIALSKIRITEFYEHYDGNVVVSFSGGKDSTVLLHLVRSVYPHVGGVYCDTGLEYPEVKEHVKKQDNIEIIRPKLSFREVIDQYGWVFPSKETAEKIYYAKQGRPWAINNMNGLNSDGTPSKFKVMYKKWKFLVDSPFKIHRKCCYVMKKQPFNTYAKTHKCGMYLGILASEGQARKQAWTKTGCNVFHHNRSQPLAFWTEQDILQYIKDNNLAIPSVYGDIVEAKGILKLTGVDRTGCMFCPIGVHLEKHPNRFQRMKITHPKIYDYCINQLGLGELLDYVGVDYK